VHASVVIDVVAPFVDLLVACETRRVEGHRDAGSGAQGVDGDVSGLSALMAGIAQGGALSR